MLLQPLGSDESGGGAREQKSGSGWHARALDFVLGTHASLSLAAPHARLLPPRPRNQRRVNGALRKAFHERERLRFGVLWVESGLIFMEKIVI